MNRAFLFPVVCLWIVPVCLGCGNEQAKLAVQSARMEAALKAEEVEKLLLELEEMGAQLDLERTKSNRAQQDLEASSQKLAAAMVGLEKKIFNLTQENMELRKAVAEMEGLKQELAALKGAQEKPAEE